MEEWPRAQRAPADTACPGFPSTFTARPSRVLTHMPHSAAHSRHTVVNQVETPGVMSSGGTT